MASGKMKVESARKRVESAASISTQDKPKNIAAFLDGARGQLMAGYDKPEWQYPALWSSCFAVLADHFVECTDRLISDWAKFPEDKKHEVTSFIRTSLLDPIDIESVDTEEFDLRRQLIRDYEAFNSYPDLQIHVRDLLDLSPKPLPPGFDNYSIAPLIFCQDARLLGAGLTIEKIILHGVLDHFEPLRDPFGKDRDELDKRVKEWTRVDEWVHYWADTKDMLRHSTAGTFRPEFWEELRSAEKRHLLSPLERIEQMKAEGVW